MADSSTMKCYGLNASISQIWRQAREKLFVKAMRQQARSLVASFWNLRKQSGLLSWIQWITD